jgi:lipopolysaccharide biosynthesis regulator YciM
MFHDGETGIVNGSPNYQEAFKWYQKAAELGNNEANGKVGLMLRIGEGVEKDFAKALKWLERVEGDWRKKDVKKAFSVILLCYQNRSDQGEWEEFLSRQKRLTR